MRSQVPAVPGLIQIPSGALNKAAEYDPSPRVPIIHAGELGEFHPAGSGCTEPQSLQTFREWPVPGSSPSLLSLTLPLIWRTKYLKK